MSGKCFAFRPQPALPRKLDSVNLVPRGQLGLYKRPRGIGQGRQGRNGPGVFDAPSRSEYSTFKKCNKEITVGRINVTKVQKLVPNQSKKPEQV